MTEIEVEGVVLGYFIRKKDSLLEELRQIQDNIDLLQGAIDKLNSHHQSEMPPYLDKNKQGALASMYMDLEKLYMKIAEKKVTMQFLNDAIMSVNKGEIK